MRLQKLDTSTSGDFGLALRQARALATRYSAEQLITALEEECTAKLHGIKLVAGFISGYQS